MPLSPARPAARTLPPNAEAFAPADVLDQARFGVARHNAVGLACTCSCDRRSTNHGAAPDLIEIMTHAFTTLAEYGWTPFFQSQLSLDEVASALPVRVLAVHRGQLEVAQPGFRGRIASPHASDDDNRPTVGDWLLLDRTTWALVRLLARTSQFRRRAPGTGRETQLIAANVDTLFVVTSCNQDFNPARLERFLAVAREAGVTPVVVLTKSDLAGKEADGFVAAAAALLPGVLVEAVDARDPASVQRLSPWCGPGQTVALVGSSGVGKSTLVNTLTGTDTQDTGEIREDDARGRHTTSGRSLHALPSGGWLMDTPGMRELALAGAEAGIDEVFADIGDLAAGCRFTNCRHDNEPGCAVRDAIAAGTLDSARLRRFRKLAAEEAHNARTLAESRARTRAFGKKTREAMRSKQSRQET
ncbi:MAG: ribosome small subunit-dependent GTPase A [Alphaproteobacteria bacterium]